MKVPPDAGTSGVTSSSYVVPAETAPVRLTGAPILAGAVVHTTDDSLQPALGSDALVA